MNSSPKQVIQKAPPSPPTTEAFLLTLGLFALPAPSLVCYLEKRFQRSGRPGGWVPGGVRLVRRPDLTVSELL